MKVRFVKMGIDINGQSVIHYIKEIKNHWWNRWKPVMDGAAPLIFYKLPEGMRAINELPCYSFSSATEKLKEGLAHIPPPPKPHVFKKGDENVRRSMIDMIKNADSVYVGIMQDDKYYVAYDASSEEVLEDLKSLDLKDNVAQN